jgi:hypothetical protein
MTEEPEASVLTARRAAQHVRLPSRDDAYEHLCILTLLSSLVLLCYKTSQAPSITKRAGGELLDKMSGNLNS